MKQTRIPTVIALIVIAGTLLSACSRSEADEVPTDLPKVVVYKDVTCGCCEGWIEHMRKSGFTVETINRSDMQDVKDELGVKREHRSCHTAVIDGYVVEGHVPAGDVLRMLKTRPNIAGIAAPGMPGGSPGMEMAPKQPYRVIAFTESGQQFTYQQH